LGWRVGILPGRWGILPGPGKAGLERMRLQVRGEPLAILAEGILGLYRSPVRPSDLRVLRSRVGFSAPFNHPSKTSWLEALQAVVKGEEYWAPGSGLSITDLGNPQGSNSEDSSLAGRKRNAGQARGDLIPPPEKVAESLGKSARMDDPRKRFCLALTALRDFISPRGLIRNDPPSMEVSSTPKPVWGFLTWGSQVGRFS